GPLEFEAKAPFEAKDYEILVKTMLRIEIGELLLAELPVKIELPDFKVAPLPKGKELNNPSAANNAASALMSLSLDDVEPKANVATGKPAAQAT
ncbi:hypothetical protein, partial [Pseudomonas viridiflava]|uniref:hypothetical protein n=1 Tax=Pseudomonas viridiflava TaxID=33069 RepID=UPI001783456C